MYDIFYIGQNEKIKEKYPFAKSIKGELDISPLTKMYWLIDSNTVPTDWEVFDYKPDQYTNTYKHVWKWNSENYGGISLIPKGGSKEVVWHNKIVCKKQFDILFTDTPGNYFEENPYSTHVWCVDPEYVLGDDINWAPGNFEPNFIHSFHLRGQLEYKYPEKEGGIKLYPRDWRSAQLKYHTFLDTNISYPIMWVDDVNDYSKRDIYKDQYVWLIDKQHKINSETVDWVPNPFEKEMIHCFRMPYQLKETYPMAMGGIRLVPKDWKEAELKIHPACPIEDEAYDVFYVDEDEFNSDTYEDYASRSKTEWFWIVDRDFSFNGKLLFVPAEHEQEYIHVFKIPNHLEERYLPEVKEPWDIRCGGIRLVNKNFDMTKHKYQEDIVPVRYDIFYSTDINDYETHARKSRTKMFWLVDSEHQINEEFKYVPQRYDQKYINIFKLPGDLEHKYPRSITNVSDNRCGGVKLVPIKYTEDAKFIDANPVGGKVYPILRSNDPNVDITEDTWIIPEGLDDIKTIPWQPNVFEKNTMHVFAHGLLKWKPLDWDGSIKEHDFAPVVLDVQFEKFSSFEEGVEKSKYNWFWVIDSDVIPLDNFNWDFQPNIFDDGKAHVWQKLNPITNKQYDYGGISLRHKHEKRGRPKYMREPACVQKEYPVYTLTETDYKSGLKKAYEQFASKTTTNMFWVVDSFVEVDADFDFSYYPTQYDIDVVHAWKHNSKARSSGIRLVPTSTVIESDTQIIENGFYKLKELPSIATYDPVWPLVKLSDLTAEEVQQILENNKDVAYVWTLEPGIELEEDVVKKSFLPHVNQYDVVHVWKNQGTDGYGGLRLWPTSYNANMLSDQQVSTCSIPNQFIMDSVAGPQKQFPVYTLTSDDISKGLKNTYEHLASITDTRMFWVVDPFVEVDKDFDFTYHPSQYEMDIVHVWEHKGDSRLSGVRLVPTKQVYQSDRQIFENSFDKLKEMYTVASKDMIWEVVQLKENTVKEIKQILNERTNCYVWTVDPGTEYDAKTITNGFIPYLDDISNVHVWKNKGEGYGSLKLWPVWYDVDLLSDNDVSTSSIPDQVIVDAIAAGQKQFPIYKLTQDDIQVGLKETYERLAKQTESKMFWVVDAFVDIIESDFDFSFVPSQFDMSTVHVWAHGSDNRLSGVRLIPTQQTFESDRQIFENSFRKLKLKDIVATRDSVWPVVNLKHNTVDEIKKVLEDHKTGYVWTVDPGTEYDDSIVTNSIIPHLNNVSNVHVWRNSDGSYGSLKLWPTWYNIDSLDDLAVSTSSIPDQVIVDTVAGQRKQFPIYTLTHEDIETGLKETYERLSAQTESKMFWVVDAFVEVDKDFDFSYMPSQFDLDVVHIWKHASTSRQTGIRLMPTTQQYDSSKQINENSFAKLKQMPDIATKDPVWPVERFNKVSVKELTSILDKHKDVDYVWTCDPDLELDDSIIQQSIIPHVDNASVVHVWKRTNSEGVIVGHGGLRLWPTWFDTSSLTDEQVITSSVPNQFILDSVAGPQKEYPICLLTNETDIIEQLKQFEETCDLNMYWVVDPFVTYVDDWKFDYIPTKWEEHVVHVLLTTEDEQRGVRLIPNGTFTNNEYTVKQLMNNSFKDLKVVYRHATRPAVWPVYRFKDESQDNVSLKEQLEQFTAKTNSEMFFTVDSDVSVDDSFVFAYTPQLDSVSKTHVWQRLNPNTKMTHSYGGVRLWPNPTDIVMETITSDKIKLNRMDAGKMQYVRKPSCSYKPYDIVMLSYKEDIDIVEKRILDIQERTQRTVTHIRGVEGIFEAHKAAADAVDSVMFWVVDADADVTEEFKFDYIPDVYDQTVVHVWASKNPITGMEYGYGGIKLFNTQQVLDATSWGLDFTTGLSSRFKAMPEVSCVTRFNTDAYSTWRSAFRECVKLTLKDDAESKERLEGWLHPVPDAQFRHDAKRGAEEAVAFAQANKQNISQLLKINDYEWLKEKYNNAS